MVGDKLGSLAKGLTLLDLTQIALVLVLFHQLARRVQRRIHYWKLRCRSPIKFPLIKALSLSLSVNNRLQRHTVLPGHAELHRTYGSTFKATGISRDSIFSIEPENLRAVWATNFQDWGI